MGKIMQPLREAKDGEMNDCQLKKKKNQCSLRKWLISGCQVWSSKVWTRYT